MFFFHSISTTLDLQDFIIVYGAWIDLTTYMSIKLKNKLETHIQVFVGIFSTKGKYSIPEWNQFCPGPGRLKNSFLSFQEAVKK